MLVTVQVFIKLFSTDVIWVSSLGRLQFSETHIFFAQEKNCKWQCHMALQLRLAKLPTNDQVLAVLLRESEMLWMTYIKFDVAVKKYWCLWAVYALQWSTGHKVKSAESDSRLFNVQGLSTQWLRNRTYQPVTALSLVLLSTLQGSVRVSGHGHQVYSMPWSGCPEGHYIGVNGSVGPWPAAMSRTSLIAAVSQVRSAVRATRYRR